MKKIYFFIILLFSVFATANTIITNDNITSNIFYGNLNWSYVTNAPNFLDTANLYLSDTLTIAMNESDFNVDQLILNNSNTFGIAGLSLNSDNNNSLEFGSIGSGLSNALFPELIEENGSVSGMLSTDVLFLSTRFNKSIYFGTTPTGSLADADFSIGINTQLNAFELQGNKYIRPVAVGEGNGLLFQSTEVLDAGGFPFIWVTQDSQNDTVVPFWLQNGNNNSYSGIMNTFGTVPKEWVNFGMVDPLNSDVEGVDFLFNVSNYVNYCNWLQNNKSLVPEDCKYFADTTSRIVPLGFFGDLEIHRTATIHEGLLIFNDFDFITRNNNDFDIFGGDLHIRKEVSILANVSDSVILIADFEDASIEEFTSSSISPEVGRDWQSLVDETYCNSDRCGQAKGGNIKTMYYEHSTINTTDISLNFSLSTVFGAGDEFYINLDDGTTITKIYSQTGSVTTQNISVAFPISYENISSPVNITFNCDASNVNRLCYVDDVKITQTYAPAVEINQTKRGGSIKFGDDGVDGCSIEQTWIIGGDLTAQNELDLNCDDVKVSSISSNVNKVVCIKSDGNLGTCTNQPDTNGACNCE